MSALADSRSMSSTRSRKEPYHFQTGATEKGVQTLVWQAQAKAWTPLTNYRMH